MQPSSQPPKNTKTNHTNKIKTSKKYRKLMKILAKREYFFLCFINANNVL